MDPLSKIPGSAPDICACITLAEGLFGAASFVQKTQPHMCWRTLLFRSHQEVLRYKQRERVIPRINVTLLPWQQIVKYRSI